MTQSKNQLDEDLYSEFQQSINQKSAHSTVNIQNQVRNMLEREDSEMVYDTPQLKVDHNIKINNLVGPMQVEWIKIIIR